MNLNCYVFTTKKNMKKEQVVLRVVYDIDGDFQFLNVEENLEVENAALVSLGELAYREKRDNGAVKIIANQEINPNVLNIADLHTNSLGKMIMHELTGAYEGAKISKEIGVGALPATTAEVHSPTSIDNQAHNKATPQNVVYEYIYDRYGKMTHNPAEAVRVEWSVMDKSGKPKVIQSYP